MPESVNTCDIFIGVECLFCKLLGILPVIHMLCAKGLHAGDFLFEFIPYISVIAHIYKQSRIAGSDLRQKIINYRSEDFLLGTCSSDGKKEPHRLSVRSSLHPGFAVCFDIAYKLVIDIMTGVFQRAFGHGLAYFVLVHSVQYAVTHICVMALYGMNRALGKMKCHGPVIRDRIDNIFHSRMKSCLSGPYMSSDYGNILGNISVNRCHEFRILLIGCVV